MKRYVKLVSFVFSVLFVFLSIPFSVSAASHIDASGVYNDLKTMKIDLSSYKKNEDDKNAKIITFLEYAYDANNNQSDYGLYLYVYNPSGEPVDTSSQYNTVQLSAQSQSGKILYQSKCKLMYINASKESDGSDLENLYYKFKIKLPDGFMNHLSTARRMYGIVDLELQYSGEVNPRTSNISNTYICTGFQANHGYADDAGNVANVSTHMCYSENLETIEIELHPTTWKTLSSDKGENYQYEVSSVYFSIPDHYFDKYGDISDKDYKGLYSVSGEWYEYKVNGLVTPDSSAYGHLKNFVGLKPDNYSAVGGNTTLFTGVEYYYDPDFFYSFLGVRNSGLMTMSREVSYNFLWDANLGENLRSIPGLCNIFHCSNKEEFSSISTEKLLKSIFYDKFYHLNKVDDGRIMGHNSYEIAVDDASLNAQISSYADYPGSDILKFFIGTSDLLEDAEGYEIISPIRMIVDDDVDIFLKDSTVSENLFISESDVDLLRKFYNDSFDEKKTTYLMRFAVRDYYFKEVTVFDSNGYEDNDYSDGGSYYFEKTIFHNFDVLSFTFQNSENVKTIVPVSSKPTTIVGVVTPNLPNSPSFFDKFGDNAKKLGDYDWFKIILFAAGAVVSVFILVKVFKAASSYRDKSLERKIKKRELELKERDYIRKEEKHLDERRSSVNKKE